MKIVLDTNVLLQAVSARNALRPIFEAVLDGKVELAISTEILLEYEELLFRHRSEPEAARLSRFLRLAPNILVHEPHYRFGLIKADPDDNKFVDCYLVASADYLVSNDRHFGDLSAAGFPAVRVVSAAAFLTRLI